MVFDMNKLILPLLLALIIATTVMATPLIFLQSETRQTGEFVSPGSADQKNSYTTPAGAVQTQTNSKTLEPISIGGTSSLLNVFYMLAMGILIASFTTFIVVRIQRRLL